MYTVCCKQEASLYQLGEILMKEKVYRQKRKKKKINFFTAAYMINLVVGKKIMLVVSSNEK